MSKNRIVIYKGKDSYIAEFSGDHSEEVEALFKTKAIPMGFTLNASVAEVIEYVKNKHPNAEVAFRMAA